MKKIGLKPWFSSMNLNVMFGAFDMVADIVNTSSEEDFYNLTLIACYTLRLNIKYIISHHHNSI